MAIWRKFVGVISDTLAIGLAGPLVKRAGDVVELRLPDDSDYTVARGDDPVGANDLVTLGWYQSQPGSLPVWDLTSDLTVGAVNRYIISDLSVAGGVTVTIEDGGGIDVI